MFKRRGTPDEANNSSVQTEPIVIRLIVDISGRLWGIPELFISHAT